MKSIQNETLSITVSEKGAEMQSLKHLPTGRELLWQGDDRYWGGRSPILFPAVGGLWNKTCRINGKEHIVPKHGFMKEKTWSVAEQTPESITYTYVDKGEDKEAFPWPYTVSVKFSLNGNHVHVEFTVKNTGEETMYFQMGGHPGFTLPDFAENAAVDGFLKLEGDATSVIRAGRQGCIEPGTFPVPTTEDGLIPLAVETFANEALIFEGHKVSSATILDKQRIPLATVRSDAPVWLFWSPQGVHAPFICAEPWFGLCDHVGFEGDISERPYINNLSAGEEWKGYYDIEVLV